MKEYKYKINGNDYSVAIIDIDGTTAAVEVNGVSYKVDILDEGFSAPVARPAAKPSAAPAAAAAPAPAPAAAPAPQPIAPAAAPEAAGLPAVACATGAVPLPLVKRQPRYLKTSTSIVRARKTTRTAVRVMMSPAGSCACRVCTFAESGAVSAAHRLSAAAAPRSRPADSVYLRRVFMLR